MIKLTLEFEGTASGGMVGTGCCNYGANGQAMNGYDCLIIPSASKQASHTGVLP